jgi:hypothetical protein
MNTITIPVSLAAFAPDANVQLPAGTPADATAAAGRAMVDAYRAYQELRALTGPLNGLADSSPIPDSLKIDEIVVRFRVNDESKTVTLRSVQRVGDLYRLLTLEAERLINILRAQAAVAQNNAAAVEAACSRAQYMTGAQQGNGPT